MAIYKIIWMPVRCIRKYNFKKIRQYKSMQLRFAGNLIGHLHLKTEIRYDSGKNLEIKFIRFSSYQLYVLHRLRNINCWEYSIDTLSSIRHPKRITIVNT